MLAKSEYPTIFSTFNPFFSAFNPIIIEAQPNIAVIQETASSITSKSNRLKEVCGTSTKFFALAKPELADVEKEMTSTKAVSELAPTKLKKISAGSLGYVSSEKSALFSFDTIVHSSSDVQPCVHLVKSASFRAKSRYTVSFVPSRFLSPSPQILTRCISSSISHHQSLVSIKALFNNTLLHPIGDMLK
jgi:hypothetical protein